MKDNIKGKIIFGIGLIVWIVEWITCLLYTWFIFLRWNLDADFAGDAVFAKHLADTGRYIFSKDWYPTTELYIVHHQILMVPLFKVFDDYYIVWIITSAIAFLLMSMAIWYFMHAVGCGKEKSLLAVILFLNPITGFNLQFSVYFHGYLFYFIMAFVLLGTLFKNYDSQDASKLDRGIILVVSFLAGICGIRMFMMVIVPCALGYCICNYQKDIKALKNCFSKLLLLTGISAITGFLVYFLVLSRAYGTGGAIQGLATNSKEDIGINISSLPHMILNGLSIDFVSSVITISTVVAGITAVFWFFVFVYTSIVPIRKKTGGKMKLLLVSSWCGIFITIAFMVLTIGNRLFAGNFRFFSLSTFLQIPLFVMMIEKKDNITRLKDIILGFVIVISIASILLWGYSKKKYVYDYLDENTWRTDYINFLVENDYQFGISTYWHASMTIMESNGKIQVAPVQNDEEYSFYKWNTQKSFEQRRPEFILLTNDELYQREEEHSTDILYQDEYVTILEYIDK